MSERPRRPDRCDCNSNFNVSARRERARSVGGADTKPDSLSSCGTRSTFMSDSSQRSYITALRVSAGALQTAHARRDSVWREPCSAPDILTAMLSRVAACWLVVLVLAPFTAPFPTCDLRRCSLAHGALADRYASGRNAGERLSLANVPAISRIGRVRLLAIECVHGRVRCSARPDRHSGRAGFRIARSRRPRCDPARLAVRRFTYPGTTEYAQALRPARRSEGPRLHAPRFGGPRRSEASVASKEELWERIVNRASRCSCSSCRSRWRASECSTGETSSCCCWPRRRLPGRSRCFAQQSPSSDRSAGALVDRGF